MSTSPSTIGFTSRSISLGRCWPSASSVTTIFDPDSDISR